MTDYDVALVYHRGPLHGFWLQVSPAQPPALPRTAWSTGCRCARDKLPASFLLRVGRQLVSLPMYHAPSCTKFPGESRPPAQIGGNPPPGLGISYRCISISWYRVINIFVGFDHRFMVMVGA